MKKVLPVLFLIGLGFYLYAKTYVEKLNFSVNSVKIDSAATIASGFSKIYLYTNLSIENPNTVPLYINSYQADFYYGGVRVASVVSYNQIVIDSKKTLTSSQMISIDTAAAVPAIVTLVNAVKNGLPVIFDVKGTVNTSLFGTIPVIKSIQLT